MRIATTTIGDNVAVTKVPIAERQLAASLTYAVAPYVSVSLVTHNGAPWLNACLESLQAQTFADYELLILDNASADSSVELIGRFAARDPRIRLSRSPENLGFAAAHNRLISAASGQFVLLLNQDVELDSEFIRAALDGFAARPRVAAVQGRVRRLTGDQRHTSDIDTTGLEMHRDRRVVARGQGQHDGHRFAVPGPVWGADGPCPMYRRSALLDARITWPPREEILDEDFFMYKEDVDLAWRLRLLGWSAWYQPRALAWHGRTAPATTLGSLRETIARERSTPRWIKTISWRNHRLMQVKNEDVHEYLRDLPSIAARDLLSITFAAFADPRRLTMLRDLAAAIPVARAKRRLIRHAYRRQ
jgi:GT2 family glycosyltransferase